MGAVAGLLLLVGLLPTTTACFAFDTLEAGKEASEQMVFFPDFARASAWCVALAGWLTKLELLGGSLLFIFPAPELLLWLWPTLRILRLLCRPLLFTEPGPPWVVQLGILWHML